LAPQKNELVIAPPAPRAAASERRYKYALHEGSKGVIGGGEKNGGPGGATVAGGRS